MATKGKLIKSEMLPRWCVPVEKLIHHPKVRDWCTIPYPRHQKGCPNYGWHKDCPPAAPYVTDVFDLSCPLFMVFSEFDLQQHVEIMRQRHPHWSEAQLRNILYWQKTSKKQMKARAKRARIILGTTQVHHFPEALGVNMYVTARKSGIHLERIKDVTICKHIALLGWKPEAK